MNSGLPKITIDFETYFSADYNIRKLGVPEYVRDPRFKSHGCAVKHEDQPPVWYPGMSLAEVDLDNACVISHNGLFDLMVLAEKFGMHPAQRICTLSIARALLPRGTPLDLGALAPLLGIGEKGAELESSKGLIGLPPDVETALAGYSCTDAELCYGIYTTLAPFFPRPQWEYLDLVLRMGTEGRLEFDAALGDEVIDDIMASRKSLASKAGIADPKQLTSRDQFADLLRSRGVEPPTKISPANGRTTYAFSKQDPAFVALQVHAEVADLVKARMVHTSNNALTRVQRLQRIAAQPPHTIPVHLNPYGAKTMRLSGSGKINAQNLNARGPQAKLRKAFHAPKGHVIVVNDLSGIELRINMWFSAQEDKLELIRKGLDVYKAEASAQFNKPVENIEYKERQFGKVLTLACGYGMGGPKFRVTCAIGPMGIEPLYITENEAYAAVTRYRTNNYKVKESWDLLGSSGIAALVGDMPLHHRCITVEHEAITLPSGLQLLYPNMQATEDGWITSLGDRMSRIYGGILQENICQALAAALINEQMVSIAHLGLPGQIVHQVHDEILFVTPERDADTCMEAIQGVMTTPPTWAEDLPLGVEGAYDYAYTK